MSPNQPMTNTIGRQRTGFIQRRVSPWLSNRYANLFGFAHRAQLASNFQGLQIKNHEMLLDILVAKGVLKGRFREELNSLGDIQEHMLSGAITAKQIGSVSEDANTIMNLERIGSSVPEMVESLEQAYGAAASAEVINAQLAGETPLLDNIFKNNVVNIAGALDRLFPSAEGTHSKLAQGVTNAMGFGATPNISGKYRLGFAAALSLGLIATIASPFLFPAIGASLCTLGVKAALGIKIAGGVMTTVGFISRIGARYVHKEGQNNPDHWLAKMGRNKFLNKTLFPLGMVTAYTGFTFGTSVSNTFVLGSFLLQNGALLGGVTAGIPLVAILGSLIYYHIGTRRAIRANEGIPAPYGDEASRIRDIKKTYAYSGSAVVMSTMYFMYRWVATSLFVSATFNPISLGSTVMTGAATLAGFAGGYLLPILTKRYRSPFPGFISGTLFAVALPMGLGALVGDYGSIKDAASAMISLGVFAQDIHSTTHGAMFHQGQMAALYPDRIAPTISMSEKRSYAGYYGRKGDKPITSFWEKAHVTPPDVVFSAVTSAIYEPNAYLKQCILQCDMPNRGVGKGAKAVHDIVKIMDQSQDITNELYQMCRRALDSVRQQPDNLGRGYAQTISLLNDLARYFGMQMPDLIKGMRDEYKQDWKGIYDASVDLSLKKGAEFAQWAHELELRMHSNDQLTREEVEGILLYLCDRFDKEFLLSVRKDSNEYVMRIQKNENQSGLREFIANTGVEIVRHNASTGQAEVQRIVATHIRRKDMNWDHSANSSEYQWFHRTDPYLENDPVSMREYREKVKSHSKDLAYVINDNTGRPLALQTWDAQILVIQEHLDAPLDLLLADGTRVVVRQTARGLEARDNTGRAYEVETVAHYNTRHSNKIYFVADSANARQPIQIEAPPENMPEYYRDHQKRPIYTYSIDPHEYEFNLDSEFVNGRIAQEYIPIFEADRKNKHVAVSYADKRTVELDYALSGLPRNREGNPILPTQVQLNWSPMHMKVRTRDGKELIVPYLEEKNGQIEPSLVVDKRPITSWKIVLKKYAPYYAYNKNSCKFENGKLVAKFNGEYYTRSGISEVTLTLPEAPFIINGERVVPQSPEEFIAVVEEYLGSDPSHKQETIEARHQRKYNWRRIIRTEIDQVEGKIYFVYDTENKTEARTEMPHHHMNQESYSVHLPPLTEIEHIETEVFKQSVGTLPYARYAYSFNSIEEAEQAGNSRVAREASGRPQLNENRQPVMASGCPIWAAYGPDGELLGYEIERFGRPESIFELGSFDPNTVDRETVKYDAKKQKLTFKAIEWGRKLYPVERDLMDLGSEDNPNARITGVIANRDQVRNLFGTGSIVWNKTTDAAGRETHSHVNLGQTVKNVLDIIDVSARADGDQVMLDVVRKQKHAELTLTDPAFDRENMWYTAEWVGRVQLGNMTEQGREIIIHYVNPYTERPLTDGRDVQIIYSNHERLRDISDLHEPKMELREIYDKEGNCTMTPYLSATRVDRETISLARSEATTALLSGQLSILTPQAAVEVQLNNGRQTYLPLNDRIDGEDYIFDQNRTSETDRAQFGHHLPGFEDGKVGLIVGPQLSISGRNWYDYALSGTPYCALDQSIFMAYDMSYGMNYGRKPYAYGVSGGNIQPHKSRAGDGRIRESATVQNGTPVGRPMRKAIGSADTWNEVESRIPFFSLAPMPATITEDYREGKGIYRKHGHATAFYNKVVAIGAGVEDLNQILTQRRRWPTSVPIGQYWFFRDLWDELVRSKIASLPLVNRFTKPLPSHYTWDQLLHEWNGVTWYYTGIAEYMRSFAPLAFFAGFTAYPVDPIAFPMIWAASFTSSMASHIYSMKKVGNHPLESIFWGQAAYKTLVPNYIEMTTPQPGLPVTQGRRVLEELFTCRLAKECLGQFGVTALSGGGAFLDRYVAQMDYNVWLKGAAFARGLMAMQQVTHTANLTGGFAPDGFAQATTYFAVVMNTIWPFYDLVLNAGAKKLALNDRSQGPVLSDRPRHRLIAQMLQGELDRWYRPIQRNKMQYTLGITDAPRGLQDQARYLQDLSVEESREVFANMPEQVGPLLEQMLNEKYLIPAKVAVVLEAMIYDNALIENKANSIYRRNLEQRGEQSLSQIMQRSRAEVGSEVAFMAGLAGMIASNLSEENQREVLRNMSEEKQRILNEILREISR